MDLDGDGIPDILSGSWPGQIYFFKGLGKGKFAPKEFVKDKTGKPIKIESASTVFAVDWNGDGKLDLLIGDISGRVHLMLNEGTREQYAFTNAEVLTADGVPIAAPAGDSHPIAADWDGDKLLDLLLGCGDGSVLFFKNIGTAKGPKLTKARALVPPAPVFNNATTIRPGSRAKISVADWKGDGKLALLVGDFYMYQANVEIPEKDRKAVEEARKKQERLANETRELSKSFEEAREGPKKKESKAEREARERKVSEATDRAQSLMEDFQQKVKKLAKLNAIKGARRDQTNEIKDLRRQLEELQKPFVDAADALMTCELSGAFDEPPEKTKARVAKLRDYYDKRYPLLIEMTLLEEITRPYDSDRMAGSVWLYMQQQQVEKK